MPSDRYHRVFDAIALGSQIAVDRFDLVAQLAQGREIVDVQAAVQSAIRTSPELRGARAAQHQAIADAAEARVGLAPRVELSLSYTRLSEIDAGHFPIDARAKDDAVARRAAGLDDPTSSQVDVFTFPQFSTRLGGRATLSYGVTDLFLIVLPALRSKRQLEAAEHWSLRARQQAVALRAREIYYEYVRVRAQWVVTSATVAEALEHVHDVSLQVEAGVLERAQELGARARAGAAEVDLTRAASESDQALASLAAIMNRELSRDPAVPRDAVSPPPQLATSRRDLIDRALRSRPELSMLRTVADARESEQAASAALQWPRLDLVAGIDVQNPKPRVFPQQDELGMAWDVGAVLRWSPNDLARGSARSDATAAATARARAELEAVEQQVRLEVARAHLVYLANVRATEQSQRNIEPALAGYEANQALFRVGAISSREVIEAEADLRRARLNWIDAAIDARVAYERLRFAVGDDLFTDGK